VVWLAGQFVGLWGWRQDRGGRGPKSLGLNVRIQDVRSQEVSGAGRVESFVEE
jgi:hypothetical protein